MAISSSNMLIALVLAVSTLAPAATAAYNPSLIVANITSDCPVPNEPFPPEQFNTETLISTFAPLAMQIPRQQCVQQATSLTVCAFDGSLGIRSGCCSSACAAQMKQLADINCFPDILDAVCKATPDQQAQITPLVPVLSIVAERCANYQPPPAIICPDGRTIATGVGAEPYMAGAPAAEAPMPELTAPMTSSNTELPGMTTGPEVMNTSSTEQPGMAATPEASPGPEALPANADPAAAAPPAEAPAPSPEGP